VSSLCYLLAVVCLLLRTSTMDVLERPSPKRVRVRHKTLLTYFFVLSLLKMLCNYVDKITSRCSWHCLTMNIVCCCSNCDVNSPCRAGPNGQGAEEIRSVYHQSLCASCAASRYCFWQHLCICVCVSASVFLSVCLHKISKTIDQKLCNLVGICCSVNAGSGWKLVTFDLDLWPWDIFIFSSFANHISSTVISFKCLNLATSFSIWRYIFRISWSLLSFMVIGLISRLQQRKSNHLQVCAVLLLDTV